MATDWNAEIARIASETADEAAAVMGEVVAHIGPDADAMRDLQADAAIDWLDFARSGVGVRWNLRNLDRLTGPLFPGWSVYVGGYDKTGKTTFLQTEAMAWANAGVSVTYVGTETEPPILRLQAAAIALGLSVGDVIGDRPMTDATKAAIVAELQRQRTLPLHYAATQDSSLAEVLRWMRWAKDQGSRVLVFDHAHRLNLPGQGYFQELGTAVRTLTRTALDTSLLLICAAQLREDTADKLSKHEPPADHQWFGTRAFQQEAHVALQFWRPLKRGFGHKQRKAYLAGELELHDMLETETIGVRLSAHRVRGDRIGETTRLRIRQDRITDLD